MSLPYKKSRVRNFKLNLTWIAGCVLSLPSLLLLWLPNIVAFMLCNILGLIVWLLLFLLIFVRLILLVITRDFISFIVHTSMHTAVLLY